MPTRYDAIRDEYVFYPRSLSPRMLLLQRPLIPAPMPPVAAPPRPSLATPPPSPNPQAANPPSEYPPSEYPLPPPAPRLAKRVLHRYSWASSEPELPQRTRPPVICKEKVPEDKGPKRDREQSDAVEEPEAVEAKLKAVEARLEVAEERLEAVEGQLEAVEEQVEAAEEIGRAHV